MFPRRAVAACSPCRVSDGRVPVFHTSPLLGEGDRRPDQHAIEARIADFTNSLRPKIREFLTNPPLRTWVPPETVDDETREFYSGLQIPLVNGKPSVLLHDVGGIPNPNANSLFQGSAYQ
jgi:hypothetical protein